MPHVLKRSRSAILVALLAAAVGLLAVQAAQSQSAPPQPSARGVIPWAI
ncbi:MAG: hypothetical protein IPK24_22880 [Kineosporiaceae bacterium]|nr:hypothetical protein [Kineosporiaceae bacterium]MBK8078310.1 hypothetical protein [Kineosporiaceae bacterium]